MIDWLLVQCTHHCPHKMWILCTLMKYVELFLHCSTSSLHVIAVDTQWLLLQLGGRWENLCAVSPKTGRCKTVSWTASCANCFSGSTTQWEMHLDDGCLATRLPKNLYHAIHFRISFCPHSVFLKVQLIQAFVDCHRKWNTYLHFLLHRNLGAWLHTGNLTTGKALKHCLASSFWRHFSLTVNLFPIVGILSTKGQNTNVGIFNSNFNSSDFLQTPLDICAWLLHVTALSWAISY